MPCATATSQPRLSHCFRSRSVGAPEAFISWTWVRTEHLHDLSRSRDSFQGVLLAQARNGEIDLLPHAVPRFTKHELTRRSTDGGENLPNGLRKHFPKVVTQKKWIYPRLPHKPMPLVALPSTLSNSLTNWKMLQTADSRKSWKSHTGPTWGLHVGRWMQVNHPRSPTQWNDAGDGPRTYQETSSPAAADIPWDRGIANLFPPNSLKFTASFTSRQSAEWQKPGASND